MCPLAHLPVHRSHISSASFDMYTLSLSISSYCDPLRFPIQRRGKYKHWACFFAANSADSVNFFICLRASGVWGSWSNGGGSLPGIRIRVRLRGFKAFSGQDTQGLQSPSPCLTSHKRSDDPNAAALFQKIQTAYNHSEEIKGSSCNTFFTKIFPQCSS